jgi:hypothetical protein
VEDGRGELNVSEMARAHLDVLLARRARVHAVNRAQSRVVEAVFTRLLVLLVHGLGVEDVDNAHGLDLLGREQAELDLLDGPERTFRLGWRTGRHDGGCLGGGRAGRGEAVAVRVSAVALGHLLRVSSRP